MAGVIKFSVIRMQRFNPEKIREVFSPAQHAVLGDKKSIVLAHPGVVTNFIPVHTDIAKKHSYSLGSLYHLAAVMLTIPEKSLLFPGITKEVPGHCHFRENHHLRVL